MPTLNKKLCSQLAIVVFVPALLFFGAGPISAGFPGSYVQVKTADNPAVYFLSRKLGLKKTYINAAAYLGYGNKWADIKTVSSSELANWPEARLFKVAGDSKIYYISGNKKVLVKSPADLMRFNLAGESVLEVGAFDLDQYREASYQEVGWDEPSGESLAISTGALGSSNNFNLVPGTDHNPIGVFRFRSEENATITSLTFDLKGVFTRDVIRDFSVRDAAEREIEANISWRQNVNQLIVNFRPDYQVPGGQDQSVKVLADLNTCTNCANQTLYLELKNSAGVTASLPATGAWPLDGPHYKLVSNSAVLGQAKIAVKSLAGLEQNLAGSRIISKFTITEESGNEDTIVKKLEFQSGGSANRDDWNNFRLIKSGQVIARVTDVDSEGLIVFNINYLKIGKGQSADLTVEADLKDDYNKQATYNLQIRSAAVAGSTYNLDLNPEISNISESNILN